MDQHITNSPIYEQRAKEQAFDTLIVDNDQKRPVEHVMYIGNRLFKRSNY